MGAGADLRRRRHGGIIAAMIDILALRAASLPARRTARLALALGAAAALTTCQQGSGPANVPGNAQDNHPYDGIGDGEVLHFTGTEPFWGGQAKGSVLIYTTPENPDGETITVARFAGRNGISLTGKLDGQAFGMAVTPGECSDGMSDRTYPFTVTLRIGPQGEGELRSGCAWTDKHRFTGPENP